MTKMNAPRGDELVAAIRKRPGMYVGGTDQRGVRQILFELVGNSIDQVLAGRARTVSVRFRGETMEVVDDGPGLPPFGGDADAIGRWFLELHTTASANGHAPHVHLVYHGVGLAVTNALARSLEVESVRDGARWSLRFERGVLKEKQRVDAPGAPTGCRYRVVVDQDVMQCALPNRSDVRGKLYESAHLFPGIKIEFDDERFHAPGGLGDYIHGFTKLPRSSSDHRLDAFTFQETVEGVRVNVAALGRGHDEQTCYWSWANGVRTPSDGDHQVGLRQAMEDVGWTPAAGMIHVIFDDPQFAGPCRDQLRAPHICGIIREALRPHLEAYLRT